ncbi:MAG: hypothetical protein ACTSP5_15205 [Candidatus Heimdallarchaeota archaeon]
MKYSILAEAYKKLDATTKRLEMIDILIQLFQTTPKLDFRRMLYLSSGKIGADYLGFELGFADKTVLKAIAKATGRSENIVTDLFRKKGDLGEVIEILKSETGQQGLGAFMQMEKKEDTLELDEVWAALHKIAETEGKGSAGKKANYLIALLAKATPLEAKYITRTALSQLRLGVKDLSLIEALARTYGTEGENAREEIEHAYNVTSDIGEIGEVRSTGNGRYKKY